MVEGYFATITRDHGGVTLQFIDFPSITVTGIDFETTVVRAEQRLLLHIMTLHVMGESLTKAAVPSKCGPLVFFPIDTSGKKARVMISIDASLLAKIDALGVGRSQWLEEAAIQKLSHSVETK